MVEKRKWCQNMTNLRKKLLFTIYAGRVWPRGWTNYLVHMTGTIQTNETSMSLIEENLKSKIQKALQVEEELFQWLNVAIWETNIDTTGTGDIIHVDTLIEFCSYDDEEEEGFREYDSFYNQEEKRCRVNEELSKGNQ